MTPVKKFEPCWRIQIWLKYKLIVMTKMMKMNLLLPLEEKGKWSERRKYKSTIQKHKYKISTI